MKIIQKINNLLIICLSGLCYLVISSSIHAETQASIKQLSDENEAYQKASFTLTTEPKLFAKGDLPEARVYDKYNSALNYPVNVEIDKKNKNQFNFSVENLPAGYYRLLVDVPKQQYFLGMSTGYKTKTLIHDFTVHDTLAGNCFNFDNKENDLMGWSSSHVFIEARDEPVSPSTCPGLFFVNTSWPEKLNQTTEGGSLFVPVSSECFPKTSNQMSKDPHWTFSVQSPDLSSKQEWQKIRSINLRVASSKIPIKVLPEVHYTLDNKKYSTIFKNLFRKKFEVAGEGWSIIDYPFELPKEAVVTGIELHFYGIPEQTVGDEVNSILVDGICPVR